VNDPSSYDIVILGNHLATGALAAILARHKVRVALVRTSTDRARPAGETTVPYTAELFFLLGNRFQVPELTSMGMFQDLPPELREHCGVKRNLGFLYHRAGTAHEPDEALQFTVPEEHAEWHLYRPDVDDYVARLAGRYGADVIDGTAAPHGVKIGEAGVTVTLDDGRIVAAEYLVDGAGAPDLLPADLPVLDGTRLRHRARLAHTYFSGVRPFESIVPLDRYTEAAGPWSDGTLLHMFRGGWIQLVPFGNHAEGEWSRCGVTVSLDPDAYAEFGDDPDERFARVIGRFPQIARQFEDAVPTRPWWSHESWPAMVGRCAGPRWFLFDRGAGRHDLLLSRDLGMSLELVHATAAGLLGMAADRDWTGHRMDRVGEFQVRLLRFHDRLVYAARTATADFPLVNAYLRVWLLWTMVSALSLKRARLDGQCGSDPSRWAPVDRLERVEYWYTVPRGLSRAVNESLLDIASVPDGRMRPWAAADRVFKRLRRSPLVPPIYRFGDPAARYYRFTRGARLRMIVWVKTVAPKDFRRLLTVDNVTARPEDQSFDPGIGPD
jgi:tetracycline 7-halogenase / FADH2 O2-dependent halogenase